MTELTIEIKQTKPYLDQKPGTSGLRKRVKVFQQPNYTENFVQAILSAIPNGPEGKCLVVGGDGRYFSKDAIKIICQVAAGNKVRKLIIGQNGILSTPAASHVIRSMNADGGILLTASHNPGGPENDFGIKYNVNNGGPAPEGITNRIYELSKSLYSFSTVPEIDVDLAVLGVKPFGPQFTVEVIDSVSLYVDLMKSIYDFSKLKIFFENRSDFKFLFDSMHGVTGPYAQRIFVEELGLGQSSVMNAIPSEDFGGGHPDPNLTYAHELVERVYAEKIDFGAASDGDGDRNMIVGHDCFVNPSDSVAVIAANALAIPYFKKAGLKGLARSMPTSGALDRVAKNLNVEMFEVPTGWKFFGNLMDAGRLSICGEESFGTGSDHIREKDGMWAVLAWLSILAYEEEKDKGASLKSVLGKHYEVYGRNYFSRYDYEEVSSEAANMMIAHIYGQGASSLEGKVYGNDKIIKFDDFEYTDPIDQSVSKKQGIRILFEDGSRIIFRLSGTGSQGATIRLYLEKYSATKVSCETQAALKELLDIAMVISNLKEFTGRNEPTVIT